MNEKKQPQDNSANVQINSDKSRKPEEWHKPELQRLRLSMDTASSPGSVIDGAQTGSININ